MSRNNKIWFTLPINPEPWAIGPVSVGRKNGKAFPIVGRNQQLASYKEAVREVMLEKWMGMLPLEGDIGLRFFFYRDRAVYTTPNQKRHRKHDADATNLQKATEDALQGILFSNDKSTRDIRSVIVEQGPDVHPCVIIAVWVFTEEDLEFELRQIPPAVNAEMIEFASRTFEPKATTDRLAWGPEQAGF